MNDRKFKLCYDIIGRLQDMQTDRYHFKKIIANAYDGNCYTISGVVYDESDTNNDLDGALFLEVSTDYLAPTLIDIDGFSPRIVEDVVNMIPTKCFIRISSHYTDENGVQHEYVLNELDVDLNTIIEDWLTENLPAMTWRNETDNRLLCYSCNSDKNYLIAELIYK